MRTFKKILPVLAGLALFFGVNALLNYLIIPYQYTRFKIHTMETRAFEDLILGSSHAGAAVNPEVMSGKTGRTAFNGAAGGQYPRENYYLLLDACRHAAPKRLILEYDPTYWIVSDSFNRNARYQLSCMAWSEVKADYFSDSCLTGDLRYVLMPWSLYRDNFGNIEKTVAIKNSGEYKQYGIEPFQEDGQSCREDGFLSIPNRLYWDETPSEPAFTEENRKIVLENRRYFEKTVDHCRKQGIEIVVFTTPVPASTKEKNEAFYKQAHELMADMAEEHGFVFLDFIMPDESLQALRFIAGQDWEENQFADSEGHMHKITARRFSRVLGKTLRAIEKGTYGS